MTRSQRPSKADLLAAQGKTIHDVIAHNLDVLFCGINPGLYSGYTGHHFARPGNRFWPAIHAAGFTDRLLTPAEEQEMLRFGLGITNLVARATATAADSTYAQIVRLAQRLVAKVNTFCPRVVAVLGVTAYRAAFDQPRATLGPQPGGLGGAALWVLPNPSGLNAHYTPAALAQVYREFRLAVAENSPSAQ